ncbi:MAG: hypothetical protein D3916_00290 [Candidatus Electrothrix sp. MAN1_4]|nr:hypothetical protein [Candidatus Electrothrix sp. MAN1_4]
MFHSRKEQRRGLGKGKWSGKEIRLKQRKRLRFYEKSSKKSPQKNILDHHPASIDNAGIFC